MKLFQQCCNSVATVITVFQRCFNALLQQCFNGVVTDYCNGVVMDCFNGALTML